MDITTALNHIYDSFVDFVENESSNEEIIEYLKDEPLLLEAVEVLNNHLKGTLTND